MPKYSLQGRLDRENLSSEQLRAVYYEMCLARLHVERVVQECSKGNIKFAIWGPGEELHGAAQALAYDQIVNPEHFAICGHYRSAGLLAMWARLRGYDDFHLDHMRQQLSRVTDPWSAGRQMTAHFNAMSLNMLPVQSSLGMQLGKTIGYAQGYRTQGIDDAVVIAQIGDGTMAESDFHEGMTGASVLGVPALIVVTDNDIAISVTPDDGRGIRDLEAYAKAFGLEFFQANGNDFVDVYTQSLAAATYCKEQQKPALFWIRELSRLNGHSNAGVYNFEFEQHDPLNDFGEALVELGVLDAQEIIRRNDVQSGKDYFVRHELGELGRQADQYIQHTMEIAAAEPEPEPDSVFAFIRPEFPAAEEAPCEERTTVISLNGAIRAALRDIMDENVLTWLYGQDVAARGGVMQATMGLHAQFPMQVRDAPINEPLIVGSALGFALHEGATALPEIQFSDYSLNTLHWLVHLGNLYWASNGTVTSNVILRLPVEPLHGGAMYHSMCMESFYAAIPGLTIVAPTTSRDCYGLLRSAAEYDGPVLVLESKGLYRMPLGDAFPGEPEDPDEVAKLKRAIGFQGLIPELPRDFRVPLGKAALRREGSDLTMVTWGRSTIFCTEACEELAAQGISVELIDLRTIVPPDLETIYTSVAKTGRILVVHEDRVFASLGREIQGAVIEHFSDRHVPSMVIGQLPVPGIPQNVHLEHHIVMRPDKVVHAVQRLLAQEVQVQDAAPAQSIRPTLAWMPNRYFLS